MNDKSDRVFRGGCGDCAQQLARLDFRLIYDPGFRGKRIGIRLVEVVEDPEPASAAVGSDRVGRGGSWKYNPRLDFRIIDDPGFRSETLGLRLVEVIDE